jgi:Tol biopolymer transport system component
MLSFPSTIKSLTAALLCGFIACDDETGPPRIPEGLSTSPLANAISVSRYVNPSVTFTERINPSVFEDGGIVLRVASTGELIPGTFFYDSVARVADFWPLALLPPDTRITVSVPAVSDAGNKPLAAFTFSFTTGATPENVASVPARAEQLLFSGRLYTSGGSGLPPDLYKMRADGSGRVNLTDNPANDVQGSWSPDGRHIVFTSNRTGTSQIFLMRDDGHALRQLTSAAGDQSEPRWSNDGRKIIYKSTVNGATRQGFTGLSTDLWVMNSDGTGQTALTKTPDVWEYWAQWSPDGTKLLYTLWPKPGTFSAGQITIASADGSNSKPLLSLDPAHYDDDVASWSPDGTRIAFSAFQFDQSPFDNFYKMFVTDVSGQNPLDITTLGTERFAAWSPDGSAIFHSYSANETWGRFGIVAAAVTNVATKTTSILVPIYNLSNAPVPPGTFLGAEVGSPQAWRR